MRIGDWTEHISSSGKRYFYNARTEVSQWEKPREWLEWEKKEVERRDRDRAVERNKDRSRISNDRHTSNNYSGTPGGKNGIKRSVSDHHPVEMDMSPGDSTPTSETSEKRPRLDSHDSQLHGGLAKLASHSSGVTLGSQRIPSYPIQAGKELNSSNLKSLDQTEQQEALKTLHAAILLATHGTASTDAETLSNGPPTPTHSESHDSDHRKASSVISESVSQSAPSLSQIAPSIRQMQPQVAPCATLSPSLAKHFKPELLGHVSGWPAEILERQAQRTNDEMQSLGNLHCTKVSCELKMSRSLVRITDIQSTLQEQRLLFLRQQIKELEEMKSTSFSFT